MKFTWFNLMPWPYLPDDFREKYRSVWVDIPSSLYDPVKGHELYNVYLDELEYAEQLGYDGIGVNEHHANALRDDAVAEHHGRRARAADVEGRAGRARQLDRAVQPADPRRRRVRDARRHLRRPACWPGSRSARRWTRTTCYGDIPALTRERVRRSARADHARVARVRAVRLQRPLHQAALRELLAEARSSSRPPIFIPGGGSIETYDFCLDFDYVLLLPVLRRLQARASS